MVPTVFNDNSKMSKVNQVSGKHNYAIRKIPNKGLGMVATVPIKAGSIILVEKPLLSISLDDIDIVDFSNAGNQSQTNLVKELNKNDDEDLKTFFSLCDSFTEKTKIDDVFSKHMQ